VKKEDDVATKKITAEDDVELQRLVDRTVGNVTSGTALAAACESDSS